MSHYDYALERIRKSGFTNVKTLSKDNDGTVCIDDLCFTLLGKMIIVRLDGYIIDTLSRDTIRCNVENEIINIIERVLGNPDEDN